MLADGLPAIFALEAGVQLDTGRADQGGALFGRQAYVGLKGKAGAVTVGRQFKLDYVALAGAGEAASDPAANRAWGISVGIERGPLMIRATHQNRNLARVAPATPMGNTMDEKNSLLAANVRVGIATAYAAYSVNRGWGSSPLFNPDNPYGASMASSASSDSRDVLLGLALPCGPTTLLASYIRKNDRDLANRDANQVALGATYALSHRTDFYASYSRIAKRDGAGYSAGASALNLGMRHAF
jgi:predicted porin